MTDRELLEMAAKAAGLGGKWADFPGMDLRVGYRAGLYIEDDQDGYYWNPIEDDGDAFRLLVMLRMNVDVLDNAPGDSTAWVCTQDYPEASSVEGLNGDDFAATRRAIVRAAAQLGKTMP